MDDADRMQLRAEVAAEAYLAEILQATYADTDQRFTDDQIDSLRNTFTLGWMKGYLAATKDTAALIERKNDD